MNRPRRCTRIGCVRWYWKLLEVKDDQIELKALLAGDLAKMVNTDIRAQAAERAGK